MILVEGDNDQHFIFNLCERLKFTPVFKVEKCEGDGGLFKKLKGELDSDRTRPLGIVVDADDNLASRIQEIITLTQPYFELQTSDFKQNGLVVKPKGEPKFGVWVWPDNQKNCILEDLFLELVQDKDLLLEESKKVVNHIKTIEPWRFKPQHKSKAIVHTWLAWQDKPGSPIGASLKRSNINLDRLVISNFTSWLSSLYSNNEKTDD